MNKLISYHLYLIGFAVISIAAAYLNWNCPPNYDEAHAWNIARYLSPAEIFTIGKTEGHPFLWYYLLMPFAKTNFFYPYSLYFLNLIIILSAFYCLYKYAPFPAYAKYLITLSAPFLQLYSSFSRSYSLGILLLFCLLSLYPKRLSKPVLYLTILLLLANTSIIGLIAAFPLGLLCFYENLQHYLKKTASSYLVLLSLNFALLELYLLGLQFYGYDPNIPQYTPIFRSLPEDLNRAFYPLNIWGFAIISLASFIIFILNRSFKAAFFLFIAFSGLIFLFGAVYHGAIHHHYFFFVYLIAAYWLAGVEKTAPLSSRSFFLLSLLALLLIFNPYALYKKADRNYLQTLRQSAETINQLFPKEHTQIYILEHFDANIIRPYLNDNITLLNQTLTNFTSLKAFQESLYHFYRTINRYAIIDNIRKNPTILLYRTCGEQNYYNMRLTFHLKYNLNNAYCLYAITAK